MMARLVAEQREEADRSFATAKDLVLWAGRVLALWPRGERSERDIRLRNDRLAFQARARQPIRQHDWVWGSGCWYCVQCYKLALKRPTFGYSRKQACPGRVLWVAELAADPKGHDLLIGQCESPFGCSRRAARGLEAQVASACMCSALTCAEVGWSLDD